MKTIAMTAASSKKPFFIINKSNIQNWFAQQWGTLVLNSELRDIVE
ncbi:MAG: hypothetical protein QNK36_11965 [Colwellia sp.]|nr:hypothetical protein [Colwellia sp.]